MTPQQQAIESPQATGNHVTATLKDVSKLYGTLPVLRHLHLTLGAGCCYVLVGDNGAGKSTLLRMLAGLLQASYGEVRVFGQPPFAVREQIGYMGHSPMLYDEYTALENLRYFRSLYQESTCLTAEAALCQVGLDPALRRPVRQYSQGMRQRVSLARVLVAAPELLLLDEPFSNMDRVGALQMLSLLDSLRAQGRTIVLTTHQRELAEPLADALLLLQRGSLTVEARTRIKQFSANDPA